MEQEYIIRNCEDRRVLSKLASVFTTKKEEYFITTRDNAEWLVQEFDKEKSYEVKLEKYKV